MPQALDEDLGGGLDVVHPRSVPPQTLLDQNEMLALWITPRSRRAVAGNAHACTERSTDAVVPPELRLGAGGRGPESSVSPTPRARTAGAGSAQPVRDGKAQQSLRIWPMTTASMSCEHLCAMWGGTMRLKVGSVDRSLRRAGSVMVEGWSGASAVAKMLRSQRRERLGSGRNRQVRCGHLPHPPVMLVHGLGADRSCFSVMEEYLHDRGYTVYSVSYSCVGSDIHACARNLEREAAWLIEETGSESLYVVAHSLGGVVLRWASMHTRMRDWLTLGVTLGSPHFGTPTAHLAPARLPGFGRIVSQLRPGAHLTTDFDDQRGVRWVAIAGASDLVVPPKYARLPRATNVRNVLVPWCGHLTLTNNRQCLDIILEELDAAGGMASTMCAIGESATSGSSHPRSQCA